MNGKTRAGTTMSIHAHIKELRTRLFVIALIFIVASMIAYVYRDPIIAVLLSPLQGQKLSYLTPGGGFSFIFKIAMWGGIAVALPFVIYMTYGFISPILPPKAQRKSAMVLLASFVLLCCGAVFGYIFAIPGAMRFLLTFADSYVDAMLTADSYLNFVLVYTIGLGILFQIPLLMVITNWIFPLKPKKLLSLQRYVVVVAFILAALITPTPDAVNQAIIAAPIIAMYQIGFVAVVLSRRKERRSDRRLKKKSPQTLNLVSANLAAPRFGRQAMRVYYMQPLIAKRVLAVVEVPSAARIARKSSPLQVSDRSTAKKTKQASRVLSNSKSGGRKHVDGFSPRVITRLSGNS